MSDFKVKLGGWYNSREGGQALITSTDYGAEKYYGTYKKDGPSKKYVTMWDTNGKHTGGNPDHQKDLMGPARFPRRYLVKPRREMGV